MVLLQKWPFFQLFFLGSIGQENVFYDILEQKNAYLDYKNKKFKKSENIHFYKGVNPSFWSKNGHFPNFFFQAVQAMKMFFTRFQNKKTLFLGYKNKKFKKSKKIDIFPKGLTYGFGPKMTIFPTFLGGNIGQENVFYHILEQKKLLSRL